MAIRISAIVLLTVIILPFQNCTAKAFRGRQATLATGPQQSGNGDGYTGKVFVEMGVCEGAPDSIKAKLQIDWEHRQAMMTREDCVDMPAPMAVSFAELRMKSTDGSAMTYKDRTFVRYDRAAAQETVGPTGDDGTTVEILGTNVCAQEALARGDLTITPLDTSLAGTAISPGTATCSSAGDRLTFRLPSPFFNGTAAGVVRIKIADQSKPLGDRFYIIEIDLEDYGQPAITGATYIAPTTLKVTGKFFGCGNPFFSVNINFSIVDAADIVSCTSTVVVFNHIPNPGGAMATEAVTILNGIKNAPVLIF